MRLWLCFLSPPILCCLLITIGHDRMRSGRSRTARPTGHYAIDNCEASLAVLVKRHDVGAVLVIGQWLLKLPPLRYCYSRVDPLILPPLLPTSAGWHQPVADDILTALCDSVLEES